MGPNHLSHLELGETRGSINDQSHDAYLFRIGVFQDYIEDIALLLTPGNFSNVYTTT